MTRQEIVICSFQRIKHEISWRFNVFLLADEYFHKNIYYADNFGKYFCIPKGDIYVNRKTIRGET